MRSQDKKSIDQMIEYRADEIIRFAQKLVQTKSLTCEEAAVAELVKAEMQKLDYDEVWIDGTGNVIGRIGSGKHVLLFDSHMDTVTVIDEDQWENDPYSGIIKDGRLYGRGAVDMKCPLAASVYGAAVAKELGLSEEVTIYVSASTMEEDYDGEAVKQLLETSQIKPNAVIICEPTGLKIGTGHRGRALIEVKMEGRSCHASNPNNGINPVYLMTEVIDRTKELAVKLNQKTGDKGSLALTNIYCSTPSNNSVPQDVTIILDRRLALGETEEIISEEMDQLVAGTNAQWCYSDIPAESWTGKKFVFHSFLPAWKMEQNHILVTRATEAYEQMMGERPELFQMQASTNGVTTAGIFKIPTLVLGPGNLEQAHSVNEYCSVDSMLDAVRIYAALCMRINY